MVKEIKTTQEFKDLIYDYESEKEWIFKGDKPAILDFAAVWCGPCRMVGPILEELSVDYADKITIYKVDVDEVPELSKEFGIKTIPSILFIPLKEEPQMSIGALTKSTLIEAIKDVLKIK
jgi:thioredoxin